LLLNADQTPTWSGTLPQNPPSTSSANGMQGPFSQKLFLGGIPYELSEGRVTEQIFTRENKGHSDLLYELHNFGRCTVRWPKTEGAGSVRPGFCHVIYQDARSTVELLRRCTHQNQEYFWHVQIRRSSLVVGNKIKPNHVKMIQVVPWCITDNLCVIRYPNDDDSVLTKDWSRTIFLSALHGKMTAYSLALIMTDVFGAVSFVQINTDKFLYPTGTATVLFRDSHSYIRAVSTGSIYIKCDYFQKIHEIYPYLRENEECFSCSNSAIYFCRNNHCLRSYCKQCWIKKHGLRPLADHQPITRKQKK
ncbi:unnamed protein product, partial [Didymodactylos carnosus]